MSNHTKLNPWRFAFAFGLIWALGMLLTGWACWLFEYGEPFVDLMGSIYLGFKPTFVGGIIGAIWGFVDFFVFTLLVAWVYNCCCGRCEQESGKKKVTRKRKK